MEKTDEAEKVPLRNYQPEKGSEGKRVTIEEAPPARDDEAWDAFDESHRVRFLSEPMKPKPVPTSRQRKSTGDQGSRRRMSRQFSGQIQRAGSVTLGQMRHVSERTFSTVDPGDENPVRGTWNNQFEFCLSCLGYAVGLGNVWRFPYLCHKNGGGAFLIPYLIMLIFCGLPLLFLELSLGQYSSEGPITIWKMCRPFKGLGMAMIMVSMYLATYYNVVTGWALYYLYNSLTSFLPWSCCDPSYASPDCVTFVDSCVANGTSNSSVLISTTVLTMVNSTEKAPIIFAADDYFHKVALEISSSIANVGPIRLHLFLAVTGAWIIVFLVLMRGIKSFGKAVYFTSTFPYLVLLILLIRGVMEPGALKGLKYYLEPKWNRLLDAGVWGDAVTQIFFSTSICTGGVITLASYNRFRNNVYRDAMIIAFGNSITSIFSGMVVFSILGFMAHHQNAEIEDVVRDGPGLTFIIYPQAVTFLQVSPLWSALFFLMLVVLALSSMFPTVENISTAIIDQVPVLRPYKFWMTFATCFCLFLCSLSLTTGGGMYILLLLDKFAVGYALVIIGLFEIIVFAWLYGTQRLYNDIVSMTGIRLTKYWSIIWRIVTPILLIFCLIFTWVDYSPLKYNEILFPEWANILGWLLTVSSCFPIPAYFAYFCWKNRKTIQELGLRKAWLNFTSPADDWKPAMAHQWSVEEAKAIMKGVNKRVSNDEVFT